MYTPWGESQLTRTIAPGIVSCSTSSHGGFFVNAERFAQMPPEYQALVYPCMAANGGAWFEEDTAWVGVVLSFPQEFEAYHRKLLETWQHAPAVPCAYPTNRIYYGRDGSYYTAEERANAIDYHTRQLTEMPARAKRIYKNWYVNRPKGKLVNQLFVLVIRNLTQEHCSWLQAMIYDYWSDSPEERKCPPNVKPEHLATFLAAIAEEGLTFHYLGYQPSFTVRNVLTATINGWGNTQIGIVLSLITLFTAAFPDLDPVCVEWSEVGDHPDENAYGGGAAVAHRGQLYYYDTHTFLEETVARLMRHAQRIDNLPPPATPERYYRRHITVQPNSFMDLPTEAGATIRDALELHAETCARAKLGEIIGVRPASDWEALISPPTWHGNLVTTSIALYPDLDEPIPPSEQETIADEPAPDADPVTQP